jgi:uncharacterized protein (TIGR02271 family)
MTTTQRPIIAGVFTDEAQAQKAMDDLQRAGFSRDQIRYSVRRSGTGITDSLEGLGLPEQEAEFYNSEFEAGRTIVTVASNDRQQESFDILRRNGAYNFNTRSAQTADYVSDTNAQQYGTNAENAQRVQLREEQLQVNKDRVQTGEVSLRKEVVTEQQSINVPVTREEVVIERNPVSGQPTDQPIGEGETYRIPVSEEQITVNKQTVPTGEVSIGKRQVQENQQVSDTVRREEAHLEREGDVNVQGGDRVDDNDR